MIGDYRDGDEASLAVALEVFDLLSNTLAEYETAVSPRAVGTTPTPPRTGDSSTIAWFGPCNCPFGTAEVLNAGLPCSSHVAGG